MTAHVMKGDNERFLAAGMDGYISKPIRAQELLEAIQAALGMTNIGPITIATRPIQTGSGPGARIGSFHPRPDQQQ
jgi:DNA-binding NarL/FixJ family response regulator